LGSDVAITGKTIIVSSPFDKTPGAVKGQIPTEKFPQQ